MVKEGLERTLAQTRQLVCTIEKDEDNHHSFVKKKDSSVKFVVQHLDSPDDKFPSFAELEKSNFVTTSLGDVSVLINKEFAYGERRENHPDSSPAVASYKLNFIPGGMILLLHSHHYSNDIDGWGSFAKQFADNCAAIVNKTEFPSFDPKCLDRTRFSGPAVPPESQASAPEPPGHHPDHKPCKGIIVHLPKSKAAELKKLASPTDGSSWISTYDALTALMWRTLTKLREPLYKPDPASNPIFIEGINLKKRLTNPALPDRLQGNHFTAAVSAMSTVPQLTVAEIVSEAPLSKLAGYVRQMTNSFSEETLTAALGMLAPIGNKANLSIRADSFPPTTFALTDWRDADVCQADFGFGKPVAWRHLFNNVCENLSLLYPPRNGPAGDDEGVEMFVPVEAEIVDALVADPEWSKYFEFRGVDIA